MTDPVPRTPATLSKQDNAFRLDGRHALVTGGASGIGEATVKELVRAGAFVWIADINVTAAEALANSLGSAHALHLDVTSPASIAAASARLDRLDILVNNAGIGHVGSIETTELEDFDRLLNVNVRSVYLVTRAFLPLLFAATEYHEAVGTIVNIGSVSGMVGIKQRFAYCMSKGAVLAMTRQLAVEYPKTLRVNAVCPGWIKTEMDAADQGSGAYSDADIINRVPMARFANAADVAESIAFLLDGDRSGFINGVSLPVDGGWIADASWDSLRLRTRS